MVILAYKQPLLQTGIKRHFIRASGALNFNEKHLQQNKETTSLLYIDNLFYRNSMCVRDEGYEGHNN